MSAIMISVGSMNSQPRPSYPEIVSVDAHQRHLRDRRRVFWNLSPGGDKSNNVQNWKYPEINTGYFYISESQTIEYRFNIDRPIELIRDLDINNQLIRSWIPDWRLGYFDRNIQNRNQVFDNNGYAVLISNIIRLNPILHKEDFYLEKSHTHPKKIRNYVIVEDL